MLALRLAGTTYAAVAYFFDSPFAAGFDSAAGAYLFVSPFAAGFDSEAGAYFFCLIAFAILDSLSFVND